MKYGRVDFIELALVSRVVLLFFQYVINTFLDDFDTSNNLSRNFSSFTCQFVAGFNNWDSVYFLEIAENGYSYEQFYAFMPGYPYFLKFIWSLFYTNRVPCFLHVTGFAINILFFTLAVLVLHELTREISRNSKMAQLSVILFIFNPANVFMTSSYSESMFACIQFSFLYCLEKQKYLFAVLLLNISMVTRFNGILNVGFLIFYMLRQHLNKNKIHQGWINIINGILNFKLILKFLISTVSSFILFSHWHVNIYRSFCSNRKIPTAHWCNWRIPLSYSYVQEKYWNVGLFKYFEIKQLPNFALAFPVILLILTSFFVLNAGNLFYAIKYLALFEPPHKNNEKFFPIRFFVYNVHALFICLTGITSFHVQILTRMISSSSPVLYWIVAELTLKNTPKVDWKIKGIITYFMIFNVIGFTLHCNFYPWT